MEDRSHVGDKRRRVYCEHCEEYLKKSTYNHYKRKFFDLQLKIWAKAIEALDGHLSTYTSSHSNDDILFNSDFEESVVFESDLRRSESASEGIKLAHSGSILGEFIVTAQQAIHSVWFYFNYIWYPIAS